MRARVSNLVPNPARTLARFSVSLARWPSRSLSTFAIFFIDPSWWPIHSRTIFRYGHLIGSSTLSEFSAEFNKFLLGRGDHVPSRPAGRGKGAAPPRATDPWAAWLLVPGGFAV